MAQIIKSIRGMHDTLPADIGSWQRLEGIIRQLMQSHCIEELRTPVLENMQLFCRSIGEVTDIVEKEMYSFADRNGEQLALRPEGTAATVRAGIEHGLFYHQIQRLWYMGKMYRHERPQQGRYREFCQFGVEFYGMAGSACEAELIAIAAQLWDLLGLENITLEINTLGSNAERLAYRQELAQFYQQHRDQLGADELKRLDSNPLRILDSKNPQVVALNRQAPELAQFLGSESQQEFANLRAQLAAMGIAHQVNPRLVRGLDYYNHTVFEFTTSQLGAQGTICAGGRYDGLVAQLGGAPTPAFGFAAGMERLLALLAEKWQSAPTLDVLVAVLSEADAAADLAIHCYAQTLNQQLHRDFPNARILLNLAGGSLKNQLKKANKWHCKYVLIVGQNEQQNAQVCIKDMAAASQVSCPASELNSFLNLD